MTGANSLGADHAGWRAGSATGAVAVAAMFMANGFVMGAWAPQIPLLMPRHQVTEIRSGPLILGPWIGAVSAMLFAGKLIARFGGRAVLSVFSLALIPVLPMVVFSPNLWVLALFMAGLRRDGRLHGRGDERASGRDRAQAWPGDYVVLPRVLEPWGLFRRLGGRFGSPLGGPRCSRC